MQPVLSEVLGTLPEGVKFTDLAARQGSGLSRIFPGDEDAACPTRWPLQWNASNSLAGTLRGMHLHRRCSELYVLAQGAMDLALYDPRPHARSFGHRFQCSIGAAMTHAILVPAGVLHGLLFPVPALLLVGRSHEHDGLDDLSCRWDDPALDLSWRIRQPLLSAADAAAGSLAELAAALASWQRPCGEDAVAKEAGGA